MKLRENSKKALSSRSMSHSHSARKLPKQTDEIFVSENEYDPFVDKGKQR